jgi:hypothetical protein
MRSGCCSPSTCTRQVDAAPTYCACAENQNTQAETHEILRSLFPSWLLPAFRVMFARPLPEFSNKLNAWVTALTCQWLMGPNKVNDVELRDGSVGRAQGVLVERCAPVAWSRM